MTRRTSPMRYETREGKANPPGGAAGLAGGQRPGHPQLFSLHRSTASWEPAGIGWASEKPGPVLGTTLDKLNKAYGQDLKDWGSYAKLFLPPTEYATHLVQVQLKLQDRKVAAVSFSLSYENRPGGEGDILFAFKKKYGEPKKLKQYGQIHLVFREKPTVKLFHQPGVQAWDVSLEP